MAERAQNLSNHRQLVPLYHFVLGMLVAVNLFHAVMVLWRGVTPDAIYGVVSATALLLTAWYARAFALSVQDRVIRLEMQLRLQRLLSPAVMARCAGLTPSQLVALRFAGDAELPGLVEKALAGELASAADIKRSIRDWQADWMRA